MRPKIAQIRITVPCMHYHNNKPTLRNAGFCNVCKRELVDFTRMEDNAIAAYLLNNPHTCGLFYDFQLERDFMLFAEKRKKNSDFDPTISVLDNVEALEIISGQPMLEVFAVDEPNGKETVTQIKPVKDAAVKTGNTSLKWLALIFPLSIIIHLLHQLLNSGRATVKTHK